MLSKEQADQIKKQILQQIETFPQDKKEYAKQQILEMSEQELEAFLEQNNLVKDNKEPKPERECIFCSIVFGDIPSYKIAENKDAIAVLEINPISKGHILIIPKNHISSESKMPKTIINFANKTAKTLQKKLSPKNISISYSSLFNHQIITLLPVYNNETLSSKRKQADSKELEQIQKELQEKPKKEKPIKNKKIPKTTTVLKEELRLPKRIP